MYASFYWFFYFGSCQLNLMHYAELVPTLSTQLKIIASVKAATPDDETVFRPTSNYIVFLPFR